MSTLWKPLQATIRIPVLVIAGLIGGLVFLGATADPAPATAASFTCRISKTLTTPTVAEATAYWGVGSIPGTYEVNLGVDSRCRQSLGKGVYLVRTKIQVALQLKDGWPDETHEYPNAGRDIRFYVSPVYTVRLPGHPYLLDQIQPTPSGWDFAGYRDMYPVAHPEGVAGSGLTDQCFAERCTFVSEHAGFMQDTSGEGDVGFRLGVDLCMKMKPVDLSKTVMCSESDGTGSRIFDYYFYPGMAGIRITVTAEMVFEPMLTWRR